MEASDQHPSRRGASARAAAAKHQAAAAASYLSSDASRAASNVASIYETASARVFTVTELIHLLSPETTPLTLAAVPPSAPPPSGSLYLYDRFLTKDYKDDGHEWVKKRLRNAPNTGKVREDCVKLRLNGRFRVAGFYARSATVDTMRRRCYYLLDPVDSSPMGEWALVHYLDTSQKTRGTFDAPVRAVPVDANEQRRRRIASALSSGTVSGAAASGRASSSTAASASMTKMAERCCSTGSNITGGSRPTPTHSTTSPLHAAAASPSRFRAQDQARAQARDIFNQVSILDRQHPINQHYRQRVSSVVDRVDPAYCPSSSSSRTKSNAEMLLEAAEAAMIREAAQAAMSNAILSRKRSWQQQQQQQQERQQQQRTQQWRTAQRQGQQQQQQQQQLDRVASYLSLNLDRTVSNVNAPFSVATAPGLDGVGRPPPTLSLAAAAARCASFDHPASGNPLHHLGGDALTGGCGVLRPLRDLGGGSERGSRRHALLSSSTTLSNNNHRRPPPQAGGGGGTTAAAAPLASRLSNLSGFQMPPRITNADLAKEWEGFTEAEREKAIDDVYGNVCGGDPGDGPGFGGGGGGNNSSQFAQLVQAEMEDARVGMMEEELEKIPSEEKAMYTEACRRCPKEASIKKVKLWFLRAEDFMPSNAAGRLVKYWTKRVELFGPDRAFLPMTLSGAMADDYEEFLNSRFIRLLPGTDASGRAIMFLDNTEKFSFVMQMRSYLYLSHAALENDSVARNGWIFVIFQPPPVERIDKRLVLERQQIMREVLPVRLRAVHKCNISKKDWFIPGPEEKKSSVKTGQRWRARFVIHEGSKEQLVLQLGEYGMSMSQLPRQVGGDYEDDFQEWLVKRRTMGM